MARNRQPKTKLARKVGEAIFGYDKYFEKRQYKPGQHGPSKRRRTASEYATQLKEKQKAKLTYGLLERQFANLFDKANRRKGVTGENLLQLLELRLDNVVFRLGMARSRRQARQLVTHKHITLNGLVCNIPSATLRPGDIVSVRGKSKKLEIIEDSLSKKGTESAWLQMEESDLKGTVLQAPTREEIPENIKEQLIVELYSK